MYGAPPVPKAPTEQEIAAEMREILGPHMHIRRFSKGELLWRQGDAAGLFVSIRKGRVKMYRRLPAGGTVTLFIFMPGDVLGCVPLLTGGPAPSGAEALDAVEADVIPRSVFERLLVSEAALAADLVGLLSRRLRDACDVIESLSTPGANRRLAAALLALVPEGHAAGTPLLLDLPVAAHEFAGALGMAPETLSRAISDLAESAVLRRAPGRRLEVLDLAGLEAAVRAPLE